MNYDINGEFFVLIAFHPLSSFSLLKYFILLDHLGDSSNDPGKDGGGEGGRTVVSFLDGIRKGSAGSQKSNKIQPVDTSLSNLAPAVSVVSSSSQQQQQQPGNGSRPTSASKIGKSKLSRVVPDAEVAGQTQQAEIFDLKMQHRRGLIDGPELKKSLEQLNTTSRTSLASTSNQNLVPDSEVKRKYEVAKLELQMMHRRGLISSAEMIQQLEELKKSPLSTSQESDVPIGSALISKLRSDQSRSVEKLIKSRAQLYASQKSLDMSDESLRQKFYDFRQELQIQHRRGVMSSEEMLQRLEQFKESLVPPAYLSATSSNRHSTAGRFANGDRRASIVIAHDQRRASFALVQPRDSSHTKSQMLLIQNREMAMSSRSRMDLSLANSEKGGSKASRVNMRVEHDQDGQKRIVFLKQSLNNMEDNSPAGASSYRLLPKNSTSNLSPDPANTVDSLGGRLMEMLRTKGSSYNIAEVERLQKAAPETENTFNAVTSAKNLIGFISPASKKADPRLRRESLAIKVDQSVFSVDEDNEDNLVKH